MEEVFFKNIQVFLWWVDQRIQIGTDPVEVEWEGQSGIYVKCVSGGKSNIQFLNSKGEVTQLLSSLETLTISDFDGFDGNSHE